MNAVIIMEFVKMVLVIVCQAGMVNFVLFLDVNKIVTVTANVNFWSQNGSVFVSYNIMEKTVNS